MSLVKCQECGHDISDKAVSCPNCGMPLNHESTSINHNENMKVDVNIEKYEITSKKWKKYLAFAAPMLIIGLPLFFYNLMFGVISSSTGGEIGGSAGWFFIGLLLSAFGGTFLLISVIGNWWERG